MRRYQETADAQFETYATTRIRGAMLDELRGQDWLPRSVRAKARKIEQAIQSLEQRLMRAPTEAEIAQQMEIPLNEYQTLLHDAQGVQIVHYEDFATEPDTGSGSGQSDWTATLNHGAASGNPLDSLLAGDPRHRLAARPREAVVVVVLRARPEPEGNRRDHERDRGPRLPVALAGHRPHPRQAARTGLAGPAPGRADRADHLKPRTFVPMWSAQIRDQSVSASHPTKPGLFPPFFKPSASTIG